MVPCESNGKEYYTAVWGGGGKSHPAALFSKVQLPPPLPQALAQLPPAKRPRIAVVGVGHGW
jgi:hypothetical protein